MAMTLGALMMGKHKKEDLEEIHAEARRQQNKAKKRGLFSSIGGTLGSLLAPAAMGALGLSTGGLGLLAGKMVMSRLGRELGEEAGPKVDYGAIKKAGKHGFKGHEELRQDYTSGLEDARDMQNRQQWLSSVMNPLTEGGMSEAGKMIGSFTGGQTDIWGNPITAAVEGGSDIAKNIEGPYSPEYIDYQGPYKYDE